jgi:hypothetical protein
VLDRVECRRFLVQPAREDAIPFAVGPLHVELDERASQLFRLPRSGHFARAQPDDHILPPRRLAGMERDVLLDPVALVEDAEHRDALRHRGDAGLSAVGGGPRADGTGGVLLLPAAAARREGERKHDGRGRSSHAYSGIHGS